MSTTKITETNSEENSKNVNTESSKRKRITKKSTKPIASVKPSIADKIKQLDKQGFDHNRIAAMLMCQKSLVEQILK